MRSRPNTINYSKMSVLCALGGTLAVVNSWAADPFLEVNGMVVIEAEHYHSKANTTLRDFYTFPTSASTPTPDPDGNHASGPETPAGNGQYVEILPDTRATAFDDGPLEYNVNIWLAGKGAPRLNYRVKINSPGRYYVWGRAFSTGTEDNGVHVGVNDTWPLSGTALQWCDGKRKWYWSSNRRLPENHCGVRNGTYLDLVAGEHTIMFAQREDGFELDRFLLTKDASYTPPLTGIGPAESPRTTGGGTTSNTAPSVNAGENQTVEIDESANLRGSRNSHVRKRVQPEHHGAIQRHGQLRASAFGV
jgi:hypothetical protein